MKQLHFDKKLDVSGMNCPLPIINTRAALFHLHSQQVLYIIATEPYFLNEIDTLIKNEGHRLVSMEQRDDSYHFWVEKGKELHAATQSTPQHSYSWLPLDDNSLLA